MGTAGTGPVHREGQDDPLLRRPARADPARRPIPARGETDSGHARAVRPRGPGGALPAAGARAGPYRYP